MLKTGDLMKRRLDINKTAHAALYLNIWQIVLLIGVAFYILFSGGRLILDESKSSIAIFIIILIAFSSINGYVSFKTRIQMTRTGLRNRFLMDSLTELENLNNSLRVQRHDFMNHLQVVYGLVELDEYQEVKKYIEDVYSDIQNVSRILKTGNPAVNALLQAKILDCERLGIKVDLEVRSRMDNLVIPSWEFCRVLGNIIDNAKDSLGNKTGPAEIKIKLYEDLKSYRFTVSDNGPEIPSHIRKRIFEAGFSTKEGSHHGMGLFISKKILNEHSGDIWVSSDENLTAFEGRIPRKLS